MTDVSFTKAGLINQPTMAPNRKVTAGGLGGMLGGLVASFAIPVAAKYVPAIQGVEGEAIALLTALIGFASAYMAKERAN